MDGWDGMDGMDGMDGWVDGWMDEWMGWDGWDGWDAITRTPSCRNALIKSVPFMSSLSEPT